MLPHATPTKAILKNDINLSLYCDIQYIGTKHIEVLWNKNAITIKSKNFFKSRFRIYLIEKKRILPAMNCLKPPDDRIIIEQKTNKQNGVYFMPMASLYS